MEVKAELEAGVELAVAPVVAEVVGEEDDEGEEEEEVVVVTKRARSVASKATKMGCAHMVMGPVTAVP